MSHLTDLNVEALAPPYGAPVRGLYRRVLKRWLDVALILLAAPFVLPAVLLLAFLVRRDGGPAFYVQDRVGRDGRVFRLWKLRTMVVDADRRLAEHLAASPALRAEWEERQKLRADPRITRIGRLLRKTSLDELPQLLNVVRGEMSLVGPRPVIPSELSRYGEAKVYYLQVRPGLTGLWQISGRNDVDYERRVALDAWYVRNWTLWYDVLILFKTLLIVPSRSSGAY
jgi:Undecaprenyl-phosphate galactose phosphotransferase WbaP